MKKILGYLISIVGIAALATSIIAELKTYVESLIKITLPETPLMVVGIILAVTGIFLSLKSSKRTSKHSEEVPIYHGNRVVGYRRH